MAKKKAGRKNASDDEVESKPTKKITKTVDDEDEQVIVRPSSRSKPINMFAALEEDEETFQADDTQEQVDETAEPQTQKEPEPEPEPELEEEVQSTISTKKSGKKNKNTGKKNKSQDQDDFDLPPVKPNKGADKEQTKKDNKKEDKKKNDKKEVETKQEDKTTPVPAPATNKKEAKKKKGLDEDYLSQFAEEPAQEEKSKEAPKAPAPQAKKKNNKKLSEEDYLKQIAGDDETTPAPAPAPTPVPAKKKDKKQDAKKDSEQDSKKKETKADKEPPKPATDDKKKPSNAARSGLRELMEKKRLEQERIKREQEEEERQLRLLMEQREKERLEKERLEKEEIKKMNALRKKGLIKSKKQLEDEAKKKAMVEKMLANSYVAAFHENDKQKAPPKPKKEKTEEKPSTTNEANASDKQEKPVDEVADSWEDLADDEDDKVAPVPAAASEPQPKQEQTQSKESEVTFTEDEKKDDKSDFRSPICCVLGHVDTGKTKLLDKIRNTNVQLGEAGGITQQIGATYVPMEAIKLQTKKLGEKVAMNMKVPGLLIIDTPGHESFTNLRSRGTSLCDIAILVVDLMHGLERQTLESLNLLKMKKTPFIVALNKIDQLYDWKAQPNSPTRQSLKAQPKHTLVQFDDRLKSVLMQFQEQGFNASLYWENKDFKNVVSLVPTSAHTGEGIPDLMALMVQLTQHFMSSKITYKDEFQCTILEVKVVEGHGTTIDVILSNGIINEGDTIVVCGLNGPIVTNIRALLAPKPLRELRVKGEYIHHKQIRAAMGIKIAAQDLEGAVPGSSVLVYKPGDNLEELKEQAMQDLEQMLKKVSKSGKGVYVQASTLGSLEALLEFLKSEKIPVSGINIGPVHKKDVIASSVMLEHSPEYAIIMAFDVPVTKDAHDLADKSGVKIFMADIIYHLCDKFMEHMKKIKEEKKKQIQMEAVWPCIIKVIPEHVFHKKDPITVGVDIVDGTLKVGTPLIVPSKEGLEIGRCISIQHNKVAVNEADKGKAVAIQIDSGKTITFGRHFDENDLIYSKLTRNSIDLLKANFQDDLKKDDIVLIQKIKKVLNVPDAVGSKVKKDQ